MNQSSPCVHPRRVTWTLRALALCLAFPMAEAAAADRIIQRQVEAELSAEESIDLKFAEVRAEAGEVFLTGSVTTLLAKRRGEDLIARVPGVVRVANELVVVPTIVRSDEAVAEAVRDALLHNPATESFEVGVRMDDGALTLLGQVDSWHERFLSVQVAAGVDGVRQVENQIQVATVADRTDAEILADIRQKLEFDSLIDADAIELTVEAGRVHLEGTASTLAEKRRAVTSAWARGVRAVEAGALVVSAVHPAAVLAKNPATDAEIVAAIEAAAAVDPRIEASALRPVASDGHVTLHGTVATSAERALVLDLARTTPGVAQVQDKIQLVDPLTPALIPVPATAGPATVSVTATPPAPVTAAASLRAAVIGGLAANQFVEATKIVVAVSGEAVELRGTVNSYREYYAAEVTARTAGAAQVTNHLLIDLAAGS